MTTPRLPDSNTIYNFTSSELAICERSFSLLSSTLDSYYIPLYALFTGKHKKIGDFKFTTYLLPPPSLSIKTTTTNYLVIYFNSSLKPLQYTRANVTYYIMKHLVYTVENGKVTILFSTIVENEYWREITDFNNINKDRFKLLLNREFFLPKYKSFYTFFVRYILNPMFSLGIDTITTDDITKYCFKVITNPPHFATIAQMRDYFNNLTLEAINEFIG